jgi:hypothetical protein
VTLTVTGNRFSSRVFRRRRMTVYSEASTGDDRKTMGHTFGEL